MTVATDIFANADNSQCPDNCFRPVGIDLDSQGRLFMSSDSTGELYVLVKVTTTTPTVGSATPSAPLATPTTGEANKVWDVSASAWWIGILGLLMSTI
jgi:hypothetical protein